MDKPEISIECDPSKAAEAAELVRRDFRALLEVFERQLVTLPASDLEGRSHINDAKAAVERGIKLSNELIGMLRSRA